jgi:RNA polymerase sigma-70 factor (ECF subfamily)
MDNTELTVLLEQARTGDHDAKQKLLEACRPKLKQLALAAFPAKLAADWDASDLVQESLFEMHRDLTDFRGARANDLFAWLRTVVDHNLTDRVRHAGRLKRYAPSQRSLERTQCGGHSLRERVAADESSISEKLDQKHLLQQVLKQIAELPQRQSEVVCMRYLQGLSLDQISSATGDSQSAVAGLLFRGVRQIKQRLSTSEWE